MTITVELPDNATNYEVYEAIFGFADADGKSFYHHCLFKEDEGSYTRENTLSKSWGNSPYAVTKWANDKGAVKVTN